MCDFVNMSAVSATKVCELIRSYRSQRGALLIHRVNADLYLHVLVKVCCFGDWHLNGHHVERHVSLDGCCIGFSGR